MISDELVLTESYKAFGLDEIPAQLNELGGGGLFRNFLTQKVCKNLLAGVLSPKFNKNWIRSEFLKSKLEINAKIMVVTGLMDIGYKIYTIMIWMNLLLSISLRQYMFIISINIK